MFTRQLTDCQDSDRKVESETGTWNSVRMLLKEDGMGYSFNITTIYKRGKTHIHYKNHLEAVYCISGRGKVETIKDGKVWDITPGTLYVLDEHDEHYLYGGEHEDMVVACVFNPPLTGNEIHGPDGAYEVDNS